MSSMRKKALPRLLHVGRLVQPRAEESRHCRRLQEGHLRDRQNASHAVPGKGPAPQDLNSCPGTSTACSSGSRGRVKCGRQLARGFTGRKSSSRWTAGGTESAGSPSRSLQEGQGAVGPHPRDKAVPFGDIEAAALPSARKPRPSSWSHQAENHCRMAEKSYYSGSAPVRPQRRRSSSTKPRAASAGRAEVLLRACRRRARHPDRGRGHSGGMFP